VHEQAAGRVLETQRAVATRRLFPFLDRKDGDDVGESVGNPEIEAASELEELHQLSFWDALIVTAARKGGASRVLTEDLNPGQIISGVRIENPFWGLAGSLRAADQRPSSAGSPSRFTSAVNRGSVRSGSKPGNL